MNKKLVVLAVAGTISFILGGINPTTLYGTQYLTSNLDYSYGIGPWWNSSFSYRKLITINSSQVDSDLMNIPILVNITDTDLRDDAQDDGDDIAFVMCYGKNTQLNHEIELFNGTTGELVAWVNVTSLGSTEDTVLYMYYGNGTCNSQQNPTGVWSSNYTGVWHLNETPTVDSYAYDSTVNNNNGTFNGSMTASDQVLGQIDGSLDFDGSNDYVYVDASSVFNLAEEFTVSIWLNRNGTDIFRGIIGVQDTGSSSNKFIIEISLSSEIWIYRNDALSYWDTNHVVTSDEWIHYVFVKRSDDTAELFKNGASVGSTTGFDITDSTDRPLIIGSWVVYNEYFPGIIDEVRISNIGRNASWINTSYNTMNSSSTFLSVGSEETQS